MKIKKASTVKIIILFFTCLAFISCNQSKEAETKIPSDTDSKTTFSYRLNNEPKLFLKYWENMSNEEYAKVSELLLKEKLISKITFEPFIEVKKNYFYFETSNMFNPIIIPTFVDNKLSKIELLFQSKPTFNSLYKSYMKKYNLPTLDSICTLTDCYKENNPKYKTNKTDKEKRTDEFNEVPVDNTTFLTSKIKVDRQDYEEDYYYKILPNNFKVEKENVLILFRQSKITKLISQQNSEFVGGKTFKDYIYSLDDKRYREISMGSLSQLNSKTRTVLEYYTFNYIITYISKNKLSEMQKKSNDEMRKFDSKIDNQKMENDKVSKQNYDNI